MYMWHSVLKTKWGDRVEIDTFLGLVRTRDQKCYAGGPFKGPGMYQKCRQQPMFHPSESSTGIPLKLVVCILLRVLGQVQGFRLTVLRCVVLCCVRRKP
jgi:hypothetical protein